MRLWHGGDRFKVGTPSYCVHKRHLWGNGQEKNLSIFKWPLLAAKWKEFLAPRASPRCSAAHQDLYFQDPDDPWPPHQPRVPL